MDDLLALSHQKVIPFNVVQLSYQPDLQHDFVSDKNQIPRVVKYCLEIIRDESTKSLSGDSLFQRSRL